MNCFKQSHLARFLSVQIFANLELLFQVIHFFFYFFISGQVNYDPQILLKKAHTATSSKGSATV